MSDLLAELDTVESQLEYVESVQALELVNELLTALMNHKQHHAFLKDDNLIRVRDAVMALSDRLGGDKEYNRLFAAVVLGRISTVAASRKDMVFEKIEELLNKRPPDLEEKLPTEQDRIKEFAALSIVRCENDWVTDYSWDQVALLNTQDKVARSILLDDLLTRSGSLASFWRDASKGLHQLGQMEKDDARYNRIRQITQVMLDAVRAWDGDVGSDAGVALADWARSLKTLGGSRGVDDKVIRQIVDNLVAMLLRIVELRFSSALLAPTYSVLNQLSELAGKELWRDMLNHSKRIEKVQFCLEETALVLARQNRTDKDILKVIKSVFTNDVRLKASLQEHFADAHDLDPQTREWWQEVGAVEFSCDGDSEPEHEIDITVDRQLGEALLYVSEGQVVMDEVKRAVIPFLEKSDSPPTSVIKRCIGNNAGISRAIRQLAAQRKLQVMELKGMSIEYDSSRHDMLGGHQQGVRKVRVERDGVQKEFAGQTKVLVKPRVTPDE